MTRLILVLALLLAMGGKAFSQSLFENAYGELSFEGNVFMFPTGTHRISNYGARLSYDLSHRYGVAGGIIHGNDGSVSLTSLHLNPYINLNGDGRIGAFFEQSALRAYGETVTTNIRRYGLNARFQPNARLDLYGMLSATDALAGDNKSLLLGARLAITPALSLYGEVGAMRYDEVALQDAYGTLTSGTLGLEYWFGGGSSSFPPMSVNFAVDHTGVADGVTMVNLGLTIPFGGARGARREPLLPMHINRELQHIFLD